MSNKISIIDALIQLELVKDNNQARSLINCKLVFMEDKCLKSSDKILLDDFPKIRIKGKKPYVSRGGTKLESVFEVTNLNVDTFTCVDIGSSTGGFTDLLLKKGVNKVYSIDVGKGLLDNKLINDERVVLYEGINVKNIHEYKDVYSRLKEDNINLIVIDVSFISLKKIIPAVVSFASKGCYIIPMVKPQFEAEYGDIEKGGVVRNSEVIDKIVTDISEILKQYNCTVLNTIKAKITGPQGNQEYFILSKLS